MLVLRRMGLILMVLVELNSRIEFKDSNFFKINEIYWFIALNIMFLFSLFNFVCYCGFFIFI